MTNPLLDPTPKPRLTIVRWIFAVVGCLIMFLSGGCMLFFHDVVGPTVFVIGGIPLLIGVLIWWLAVDWGRT